MEKDSTELVSEETTNGQIEQSTEAIASSSTEQQTTHQVTNQEPQASVSTSSDSDRNESQQTANLSIDFQTLQNSSKMAQTKADFMKLAGPILNYKYNGDPLKLETFITDVELVQEMAEDEQKDLCFKFVKSKLEGRAIEAMPDEYKTVKEIIDALEAKIKADSSRVISGKIASLLTLAK